MRYKIKIEYTTGNSFGSEDASDELDLTFENLEVAKDNLRRIKEHYNQYRDCNDYYKKGKKEDIFKSNENKDWFCKSMKPAVKSGNSYMAIDKSSISRYEDKGVEVFYVYDQYQAENCIILKTDNGNNYQMSAFWTGHFETLQAAEIIPDTSDMKIEF